MNPQDAARKLVAELPRLGLPDGHTYDVMPCYNTGDIVLSIDRAIPVQILSRAEIRETVITEAHESLWPKFRDRVLAHAQLLGLVITEQCRNARETPWAVCGS